MPNGARSRTVYVTDLDGTLLRRDATLAASCRRQLDRLLAAGELITVASARSTVSMQRILGDLALPLPIVAQNGAMISELATGRALAVLSPPPDVVELAYELARAAGLTPAVACWDGEAERLYHPIDLPAGVAHYIEDLRRVGDPRPRGVPDVAAHLGEDVVCVTCIGSPDVIVALHAQIGAAIGARGRVVVMESAYDPGFLWLTLHAATATKGTALSQLLRDAGLESAEVVGFGDQTWDASLFAVSHRKVAVSNAIPSLRETATHVIGHHDEGSVVEWIAADVASRGAG